jgi:uncharacterized protein with GYD domain
MAQYLIETAYTGASWNTQLRETGNVLDRIHPMLDTCNGRVDSCFYAFGDRDLILICDFPTPEDAAAFSLACSAGGAVKFMKTTPLLTVEQGLTAMRRADEVEKKFNPPVDKGAADRA